MRIRLIRLLSLAGVSLAGVAPAQVTPPVPTPDLPRFFVWSNGIPCGVEPDPSGLMTHMMKLHVAAFRPPWCNANYVASYIYEHTRSGPWTDLNVTGDDPPAGDCFVTTTPPSTSCYSNGNHGADLGPQGTGSALNNICVRRVA